MAFATRGGFFGNTNERRGGTPSTLSALTWTIPAGNVYQSDAQVQFGASSMYGNTGYIQTTSSTSAMDVSLGPFTVEGWCYIPAARSSALNAIPIVLNITNGLGVRFGNSGASDTRLNQLQCFKRGGADGEYVNITWPRDQWNHWVVQRTGGGTSSARINFWVNGAAITPVLAGPGGNIANTTFAASSGSTPLTIGNYNSGSTGSEGLRGIYLDEVSVTTTFARYDTVGNIVVPIESNIVDNSTGLLMHFDNGNGSVTFNNATS